MSDLGGTVKLRAGFILFACSWIVFCAAVSQASALSVERHYEMVSPVFKGGFGTPGEAIQAVAPDGESVGYYSPGAFAEAPGGFFAGADYLARREATEWSTVPLIPPASTVAAKDHFDLNPSLSTALQLGSAGPSSNNPLNEAIFLLHQTDAPDVEGTWKVVGSVKALSGAATIPIYEGASEDFCHVIVYTSSAEALLSEAVGAGDHEMYEFDRGCGGSHESLALVGLDNRGELIERTCDTRLGDDGYAVGAGSRAFAVSGDGSEVFFTVCVKNTGEPFGHNVPHQLFVRLGGAKTVEVSRPLAPVCETKNIIGEVPCNGAESRASADFQGASEDGSRVYFTAPLAEGQPPLVPGDNDHSSNLYVATIGCPSGDPLCATAEKEVTALSEVSHNPTAGQEANVLGVTAVAPDGNRVYYVAKGDLLGAGQEKALEAEGRPAPVVGAANLYVYDAETETTAFVGDLCSGKERSGGVEDIRCPNSASDETLWSPEQGREVQTGGPGGEFLVFATYAQLTGSDKNEASDVYRYDATTGQLSRVSLGEGGYDDNGNHTVLDEQGEPLGAHLVGSNTKGNLVDEYDLHTRAISEDGARIVFTSAEPLSAGASNGLENAYEWHEGGAGGPGSVSLISSGGGGEPVKDVVISANGDSVVFATVVGLVPQDSDGAPDVYDARLGEGFPQPPAERKPCAGDACQGPLTSPAPLLVPGSVSQVSGGNFEMSQPAAVKKKAKAKKKRKKTRKTKRAKKAVRAGLRSRNRGKRGVRSAR